MLTLSEDFCERKTEGRAFTGIEMGTYFGPITEPPFANFAFSTL